MPDDKAAHDKALELLVYAPVGVALYLRDMLPSMMPLFVSRGKREVQSHLPGGVPTPARAADATHAADADRPQRRPAPPTCVARSKRASGSRRSRPTAASGIAKGVAGGGFDLARGLAGSALQGLGSMRSAGRGRIRASCPPRTRPKRPRPTAPAPAAAAATPEAPSTHRVRLRSCRSAPAPEVETLAIPDYDELSASQVVERLVGLDHTSLDAIRRYELAHRGRNTILGKITQLG